MKGIRLYAALVLWVLFIVSVPLLWAPGLLGLLRAFPILEDIASVVFGIAIGVLVAQAVMASTPRIWYHVKDMLPWAVCVFILVLVLR
jgi:hypothetical protein